jgi:histidinol-phosphatase (PHP family)
MHYETTATGISYKTTSKSRCYSTIHSHTNYCDGNNTAEEMILAAIAKGMKTIGISTHGPLPFKVKYAIDNDKVEEYIDEIKTMKEKYSDKIEVLLGMELDYFTDTEFEHIDKSLFDKLDYYIGSIHYLARFNDGKPWAVDEPLENILKGIEVSYSGDIKKAVIDYYYHLSKMIDKYRPTLVGHMDLIKKNNKDNILFNENDSWYKEAVCKFLDVAKDTGTVIEINTGGIARKYVNEQYPSTWILEEIKLRNIPVTINSDAHSAENIACMFDEMYELCKGLGINNIVYLSKDVWKKIDL